MQNRNTGSMALNLSRAKSILQARMADLETATKAERAVALAVVGLITVSRDEEVRLLTYPQHGYLSPMAATEVFAKELQRALSNLASNLGAKAPNPGKYNPLVATPTLAREVWRTRQVVDELGIPYGFYIEHATLRWYELGHKRMPRPSQLTSPDLAMHVMQLWTEPAFRWHYPLFADWDVRFNADHYCGDALQDRALTLIDQRLVDAAALGHDQAAVLASMIGSSISLEEANRRYGPGLTDSAVRMSEKPVGDVADVLCDLEYDKGPRPPFNSSINKPAG